MDDIQLTTLEHFLVAIVLCGGFGGLLFGHRQTGLTLPYLDRDRRRWSSGFLADIAFGVAGELVVFLIVPADFSTANDTEKTIKFLALCVLGGYAGPALLEKIIKETLKDIRKEQDRISAKIEEQEKILTQNTEQQQNNQKAIRMIDDFLNDTEDQEISMSDIVASINNASDDARFEIYQRTRSIRRKSWQTDKRAVSRTIPVFEALAGAGLPDREKHRLLAQWAYALKDSEPADYQRSAELLDEAIRLRVKQSLPPSAWYHFNRAICNIRLVYDETLAEDPALTQRIASDLSISRQNPTIAQAIKSSETVQRWKEQHPRFSSAAVTKAVEHSSV